MNNILDRLPELPKRLSILINTKKILLPGCMKEFPLDNKEVTQLFESKFKKNNIKNIIIGVAISPEVGTVGTAASVQSYIRLGKEYVSLIGLFRFRIDKVLSRYPYTVAEVTDIDKHNKCFSLTDDPEIKQLVAEIKKSMMKLLEIGTSGSYLGTTLDKIPPCFLAEMCSQLLNFSYDESLKLLNTLDVTERLKIVKSYVEKQQISPKSKVLRISNSLGFQSDEKKNLEERLERIKFPEKVEQLIKNELKELKMMSPVNPHYNILFSHLSLIADLPWNTLAEETLDLRKTKDDLEVDHFGLDKVKKRILEYLAVRKLRSTDNTNFQSPILCLVGPPGVGKTSIARSIAKTLNRPLERVSLGGVSNMADIRGHRRAYIGAMPGRIIQAIKRSGVKNPVILLDEIDKMTVGIHGNPSAALLEVLDPQQNTEFLDHYLNIPFDLSKILFIATANSDHELNHALYDRLEILRISGYTPFEKLEIAKKYLVPKQLIESGLRSDDINIPEETLQLLINNYTREAGVRSLERKIGSLCRSVAVQLTLNETISSDLTFPIIIDVETAKDVLGPITKETNKWSSRLGKPGVAVGLVVTYGGGDTVAVEASFMPGKGKLVLTGSLGSVMKESATLAWGWVRSNAHMYGVQLDGKKLHSIDVHLHFPQGAVNKDGPSAGITIAATLMSLLLNRPILPNVAMTGEITLQGVVLPVGGIKEKVIAAHKDGFNKIILPEANRKHLYDIPASIKDQLTFVLVSDMHAVIETIFEDGVNLLIPQCAKSKL